MLTKIYNDLIKLIPTGKAQRVKVEYYENSVKVVTLLVQEEFYIFKFFQEEVVAIRREG